MTLDLQRLRFVPGVVGSFVCGSVGELLHSDMPAAFTRGDLERAAASVSTLLQSAGEALERCQALTLCFADHHLHARPFGDSALCVLSARDVDRDLLRRAAEGVLERAVTPP